MAPSPSRRRRRPTATSAAVAVAVAAALPELRLATVPLGKGFFGILRGFHWFQPVFSCRLDYQWRFRQPRGLSTLPTGDHEKVICQILHTPIFSDSQLRAQVCRSPSTIKATGARWGFAKHQNRQNGSILKPISGLCCPHGPRPKPFLRPSSLPTGPPMAPPMAPNAAAMRRCS